MTGIELIAAERKRQIEKWNGQHDDDHHRTELVYAAICYAAPYRKGEGKSMGKPNRIVLEDKRAYGTVIYQDPWPWDDKWDNRDKHSRKKRLAIAGALIAAELDRLEREKLKK